MATLIFVVRGPEKDYVYMEFDGGYVALGYIERQDVYVDARLFRDGEFVTNEISRIREMLMNVGADPMEEGWRLEADAGVEWTGSERVQKLRARDLELQADGSVRGTTWLKELENLEANNRANYELVASSALRYEKPPGGISPIGRLLEAMIN
ncbi:MAG: hypothetical protein OXG08_00310 [Gammaproteobacteria bacterium]|nr:hypothetical protein [Gammaproteobacteria bacterium]